MVLLYVFIVAAIVGIVAVPFGHEYGYAHGFMPILVKTSSPTEIPDLIQLQEKFLRQLKESGKDKRGLYEEFFPHLGAEGILNAIENLWPHCHSEAHDLGKVIFAQVQDIKKGIRFCDDRCHSGCMHGVLMEAITTTGLAKSSQLDFSLLKPMMAHLCMEDQTMTGTYSPGDCAHGTGHAFTMVVNYDLERSLKGCGLFEDEKTEYYCSTGAFMEYVNTMDEEEAKTRSFFYPCDTFEFPSACARYKMVHVVRRHYLQGKPLDGLKEQCRNYPESLRLGCYHGLGNAHVPYLAKGLMPLQDVCGGLQSKEEEVCIDGAIERLAKYHESRALEVCQQVSGHQNQLCLSAVKHKMYDMEKDLSLYLAE